MFAAYTGKAALVMRQHGLCASTIHSLIYTVVEPDSKQVEQIRKRLNDPYIDEYEKRRIKQELEEKSRPHFELKTKDGSNLKDAKLLVLDECSMINEDMLLDLLTFEIPLLVLGDPGQLSPIEGKSIIMDVEPDVMLTEIHRQARGNPIIYLASRARLGYDLEIGQYNESRVLDKYDLGNEDMKKFDQIIVGKNAYRKKINQRMRELLGFDNIYPNIGEKLICLRNNAEYGLLNGMICYVEKVGKSDAVSIEYTIRPEDSDPIVVRALKAHFQSYTDPDALSKVRLSDKMAVNEFDFGYAITVHKAQGSQWNNVCLIDDGMFQGFGKPDDRKRWLYTGISRAIDKITIAV